MVHIHPGDRSATENEIAIMKLIEHPNCVKLFEVPPRTARANGGPWTACSARIPLLPNTPTDVAIRQPAIPQCRQPP